MTHAFPTRPSSDLLGQLGHQAFTRRRVVHIQDNAAPACSAQHFSNGLRSCLGCCRAHHRGAASRQFKRNRLAYAAGGAGDQSKLALELFVLHGYYPCKVSSAACSEAGSMIDKPVRSRSMRLVRPVRSEENTSELQSLMRISYADFFLKTTTNNV